jgi:predicted DsbA family dithiol-disulfide isomerase
VRIEKLKQNFEIDVRLVHFPLHPDTPDEGLSLEDLFAGRGMDLKAIHERMKALMDAEGLPYTLRSHTYNSRLAQELGKWADTQDAGDALHDALYRAYFVDGLNIGDVDVLLGIAKAVGLFVEEARKVLETRSFKDAVDADWSKSRQYGVTGVPTFVAGGRGVTGAQPYEILADLLTQAGTPARGLESDG